MPRTPPPAVTSFCSVEPYPATLVIQLQLNLLTPRPRPELCSDRLIPHRRKVATGAPVYTFQIAFL